MTWDPKEAKRRLMDTTGLSEEEIAKAEQAAEQANEGPLGEQIRELFESRANMQGAMQAMDLTQPHFNMAFLALQGMDDDVTSRAVCLGWMMNTVMILKVLKRSQFEILDLASRAAELAQLFEDAMIETGGENPFRQWAEDHDDQ